MKTYFDETFKDIRRLIGDAEILKMNGAQLLEMLMKSQVMITAVTNDVKVLVMKRSDMKKITATVTSEIERNILGTIFVDTDRPFKTIFEEQKFFQE